jgi:lipopolysaccharide heptosyltransferase II
LNPFTRLLIIRLSSLGDILLTTPVIRALKSKFPEAKIDFLLRDEYADTLKYNPHLNKTILLERNYNFDEVAGELEAKNYDKIIDLQNNRRSRALVNRTGVKSFSYKKNNLAKFLLVNFKIKTNSKILSVPERYAKAVPEIELDDSGLDLFLPEDLKANLDSTKKYVGICPGSRHFTKMYPTEYFVELGKLIQKSGRQVVIFGGRDDMEINQSLHRKLEGSIDLTNDNYLLQTAFDMKFCEAVICNDSGLMHAASSVGVPVVAIFGSTVTDFGFAPYKNQNLILENNSLNCRPCSHIGRNSCPKHHFKCMKEIYPQQVYEGLTKLLSKNV